MELKNRREKAVQDRIYKVYNKMNKTFVDIKKDNKSHCNGLIDEFIISYPPRDEYPTVTRYELVYDGKSFRITLSSFCHDSEENYDIYVELKTRSLREALRVFYNFKIEKQKDKEHPEFGKHGIIWLGKFVYRNGQVYSNLNELWHTSCHSIM